MNRISLLSELCRMEVAEYRKRGLELEGKYKHEPPKFRNDIAEILNKLEDEDLIKLYKLKTK